MGVGMQIYNFCVLTGKNLHKKPPRVLQIARGAVVCIVSGEGSADGDFLRVGGGGAAGGEDVDAVEDAVGAQSGGTVAELAR